MAFVQALALRFKKKALWLQCAQVSMVAALLLSSGMVRYDIGGVPFTMQTFALWLIAMHGDRDCARIAVGWVIALSCWGITPYYQWLVVPVHTLGYVLGFYPAVLWIQSQRQTMQSGSVLASVGLLIVAQLMVSMCGYLWLAQSVGYQTAWVMGVAPFVLTDTIKLLGALSISRCVMARY